MIRLSRILAHIILRAAAWVCFAAACGLAFLDCARSVAFARLSFTPLSAVLALFCPAAAGGAGRLAAIALWLPAFMVFLAAGLVLSYMSFWRLNLRQLWLHGRRRLRRLWRGRKAGGVAIGDKLCP